MTQEMRTHILRLLQAGGGAALTLTLLGFLGSWHWFLDLFSHFRGQYFLSLAVIAVICGILRRWTSGAIFLAGATLNAFVLSPLWCGSVATAPASVRAFEQAPPLHFITHNLLYSNHNHTLTTDWLRRVQADAVFLSEVTPPWSDALRQLHDTYPYQHHSARIDAFGCAFLSRHPWTHLEEKQFSRTSGPSLAVAMKWQGQDLLLLGMHPPPPMNASRSALRNTMLAQAGAWLASHSITTQVVLGDLNATPWCHPFRRLLEQTQLRNSADGHGWQPTWNVQSPFFQIPIDHVLISSHLHPTRFSIGPDLHSDHRPVCVTLQLKTR
jgi:endonuclease/exonuclease/phosphatase (EEP) superfamily protein YafD